MTTPPDIRRYNLVAGIPSIVLMESGNDDTQRVGSLILHTVVLGRSPSSGASSITTI